MISEFGGARFPLELFGSASLPFPPIMNGNVSRAVEGLPHDALVQSVQKGS